MHAVALSTRQASAPTTVVTDDEAQLVRLLQDGVHSVHLRRRLPSHLHALAYRLSATDLRVELSPDMIARGDFLPREVSDNLRAEFVAELRWVYRRFDALVGGAPFSALLEAVHNDKCHRFHMDYYRVRLVVTYAGLGTEYVLDEDVEPSAARRRKPGKRSALRAGATVQHATVGDLVLMKGKGYVPRVGYGGLVHRSPEIKEQGLSRLMLTLTEG